MCTPALGETVNRIANHTHKKHTPRKNRDQNDRKVIPERLEVLEFGSEVALEIVVDDEDTEEIGVAAGAEDVPGQRCCAEREDCDGMKEP